MTSLPLTARPDFIRGIRAAIIRWPLPGLCVLTVLAFLPLKAALVLGQIVPATRLGLFAAICFVGVFFFGITTSDLPKPVKLTLRGIALLFVAYFCLAHPSAVPEAVGSSSYFELTSTHLSSSSAAY
jgi:hypothetical protein